MTRHTSVFRNLVLTIAGAGLVIGANSFGANARGTPHQALPDIRLDDLEGRATSLASFRGRIIFLNLWASWCPPCRDEMPAFQQLQDSEASNGFVVIGVDQGESEESVRPFLETHTITYPMFLDANETLSDAFQADQLPLTIVFDAQGRETDRLLGSRSFGELLEELRRVRRKSSR